VDRRQQAIFAGCAATGEVSHNHPPEMRVWSPRAALRPQSSAVLYIIVSGMSPYGDRDNFN